MRGASATLPPLVSATGPAWRVEVRDRHHESRQHPALDLNGSEGVAVAMKSGEHEAVEGLTRSNLMSQ